MHKKVLVLILAFNLSVVSYEDHGVTNGRFLAHNEARGLLLENAKMDDFSFMPFFSVSDFGIFGLFLWKCQKVCLL